MPTLLACALAEGNRDMNKNLSLEKILWLERKKWSQLKEKMRIWGADFLLSISVWFFFFLTPLWISWNHLPLLGISGTFYLAVPPKGMRLWTKEIWACVFCPKASVRFFEDVNLIFTVMSPWVSSKYRPFRWWLLNKYWVEEERDGTEWMERVKERLRTRRKEVQDTYSKSKQIPKNVCREQRHLFQLSPVSAGVELNLKELW